MLSSADSLDLFRLVVEQAPDGIIFADREGVIQIWNSAAPNSLVICRRKRSAAPWTSSSQNI
jgi:hypothetical protein